MPCNWWQWILVFTLALQTIIKIKMGKHTKPFRLCSWAGKSECLRLVPPCIHPNTENSVHLLFIVYTEALQGMSSFQCWARISFLPVWYALQWTCLLKSYNTKTLLLFIKTCLTSASQGFRRDWCCYKNLYTSRMVSGTTEQERSHYFSFQNLFYTAIF